MQSTPASQPDSGRTSPFAILAIFLRLGCTCFGGPVAHLAYFEDEFVTRRRWLDAASYADLVALGQFLPGPASDQVAMGIGIHRAGLVGGFLACMGFALPSAVLMTAFAYGMGAVSVLVGSGWLHGLQVAAVAVVAQAVWSMASTLTPDRPRATLAAGACVLVLLWDSPWSLLLAMTLAGVAGFLWLEPDTRGEGEKFRVPLRRGTAIGALAVFFGLLVILPLLRPLGSTAEIIDSFYRSGALVFGSGHVVLPLLQAQLVPAGWLSNDLFLAGYGAVQAMPGPLLSFASYLGTVLHEPTGAWPSGWLGGVVALGAVYLPAFLMLVGALPFWEILRHRKGIHAAMRGVNAGVVGLLLGALYDPVWTSAILHPTDFALGLAAFLLLALWKLPPWLVVGLCALGGGVLGLVG